MSGLTLTLRIISIDASATAAMQRIEGWNKALSAAEGDVRDARGMGSGMTQLWEAAFRSHGKGAVTAEHELQAASSTGRQGRCEPPMHWQC